MTSVSAQREHLAFVESIDTSINASFNMIDHNKNVNHAGTNLIAIIDNDFPDGENRDLEASKPLRLSTRRAGTEPYCKNDAFSSSVLHRPPSSNTTC